MGQLDGQVAMVTGAGRGFGRAIAARLAGEGAAVALLSRSPAELDAVAQAIRDNGGHAVGVRCDVTDPASIAQAVATTEDGSHHWYDALAVIARCPLDWEYLIRRARQAGPRRVLSLLLYAESNDLAVPAEVIENLFEVVHPAAKALTLPPANGRPPSTTREVAT